MGLAVVVLLASPLVGFAVLMLGGGQVDQCLAGAPRICASLVNGGPTATGGTVRNLLASLVACFLLWLVSGVFIAARLVRFARERLVRVLVASVSAAFVGGVVGFARGFETSHRLRGGAEDAGFYSILIGAVVVTIGLASAGLRLPDTRPEARAR
jgi:hypothetical protein